MKALTLHQPWASLIAESVKHIETRSWSTSYRGLLAIHGGLAAAPKGAAIWDECARLCVDHGQRFYPPGFPRGAVVATCTLVDVIPIRASFAPQGEGSGWDEHALTNGLVWGAKDRSGDGPMKLWTGTLMEREVEDQRPFGDFTPGRYAWLLADVVKLDTPVPARGRQRLWEWDGES